MLSFGVVYPVMLVVHVVPKNNAIVHGLVDGGWPLDSALPVGDAEAGTEDIPRNRPRRGRGREWFDSTASRPRRPTTVVAQSARSQWRTRHRSGRAARAEVGGQPPRDEPGPASTFSSAHVRQSMTFFIVAAHGSLEKLPGQRYRSLGMDVAFVVPELDLVVRSGERRGSGGLPTNQPGRSRRRTGTGPRRMAASNRACARSIGWPCGIAISRCAMRTTLLATAFQLLARVVRETTPRGRRHATPPGSLGRQSWRDASCSSVRSRISWNRVS